MAIGCCHSSAWLVQGCALILALCGGLMDIARHPPGYMQPVWCCHLHTGHLKVYCCHNSQAGPVRVPAGWLTVISPGTRWTELPTSWTGVLAEWAPHMCPTIAPHTCDTQLLPLHLPAVLLLCSHQPCHPVAMTASDSQLAQCGCGAP